MTSDVLLGVLLGACALSIANNQPSQQPAYVPRTVWVPVAQAGGDDSDDPPDDDKPKRVYH